MLVVDNASRRDEACRDTEARQAQTIAGGTTLRRQLSFDEYLSRRRADPTYDFRRHLRTIAARSKSDARQITPSSARALISAVGIPSSSPYTYSLSSP